MAKTIKEEDLRLNIIVNGDDARKKILDQEEAVSKLTAKFDSQKAALAKLKAEGKENSQGYKNLNAQMGKTGKALDENRARLESLQRQQKISTMTLNELRQHSTLLKTALANAVPGTENWTRLSNEMRNTKNRLKELELQTTATHRTMCDAFTKANQYIQTIVGGVYSVSNALGVFRKATDAFLEYDEALTDAMKTTNLSKDAITILSDRLKQIDTKTSQNELLALVRAGGKLGVEGSSNLLGFAKAADKINVALGDDLGGNAEAAITAIGKMTDIFNLQDEFGIETAMLKVGSAINELGMASTANEGYIVDFSKRLAGIAPNADISIDKVLGMAATLDKYGQQSETSATAIGQTIMAMFKRTETFASIAKMPLQEFAELLNKDVNEALLRVLQGMNNGGGLSTVVAAMDEMHLNGQRASTVLGTLSKNIEELRSQQQLANEAFEEGISLDKEFEVKNTSLTAQMEKQKKAILENVVAIGQQLLPVVEFGMSVTEKGIGILLSATKAIMQLKGVIIALSIAYAAYTVAKKISVAWDKLSAFWSKANQEAMRQEVVVLQANTEAVSELNKKELLLIATKNLLVGNLKAAGAAFKMFGKAISASLGPAGWIALAIGAVVSAAGFLVKKAGEYTKALKELNKQTKDTTSGYVEAKTKIDEERRSMDSLLESVKKANTGSRERAEAIRKINEKYGDYLPKLLSEKNSNNEIETALKNVNTQLERKILLQAKENELQNVLEHKTNTVKAALEGYQRLFEKINGRKMNVAEITSMTEILSKTYDNGGDEEELFQGMKEIGINPEKLLHQQLYLNITKEFKKAIESGKELQAVVDGLFGTADSAGTHSAGSGTGSTVTSSVTGGNGDSGGSDGKWSLEKDEKYMQQMLALKDKYAKKEIAGEEEYKRQLLDLEIKSLEARIASGRESGEDLLKLKNRLADKRIELEEMTAKAETESAKDSAAIIEEVNNDKIAAEERRYKEELKKFQGNAQALEAVEKKHRAKLRQIMLDGISGQEAAAKRERELATATAQNRHAAELAAFRGTDEELKALKEKQAQELAQIDMNYVMEMQQILGKVMNIKDDLTTNGQVNISFEGISDEQLHTFRMKLQELIALKQKLEGMGSGTGTSGNGTMSANSTLPHSLLEGTGGGDLFGVSQEQWQTFFGNLADGKFGAEGLATAVQSVGGMAQEAMNLVSKWADMQTAIENKQLKEYEKSNNRKKKALQERLDAGLMTEAQYNSEVERMDADYDAYQAELQLKQAKRQKQIQLTQAIINTALGVTMTLAQWGVPWGLIPAGIMAAMGAAEIAMIASTPISAGAEDGGFGGEVLRAQDGKRFKARLSPDKRGFINAPTLLVSENGEEYVIPKEGLDNPTLLPFINTMEVARRNGQLKSLNFESVYPSVEGRSSGGFATERIVTTDIATAGKADPELKELLSRLNELLSRPISAEVSMLGKNGIVAKTEQYERYKKRGRL